MKKIISRIIMSTCMCLALGFTACSDDDETLVVGPQSSGAYFSNTAPSDYDVEVGETEVSIPLLRTSADEAQTVQITLKDESGFFSIPSSVSFAAGANSVEIPVTFDSNKFEPKDYELVVTVADSDAYQYGMTEYTFTIGLADSYRWNNYGTCQYSDAFIFDGFIECELQQHAINKNMFRVVDPYVKAFKENGWQATDNQSKYVNFQLLAMGQVVYGTTVTTPDLVSFDDIYTGEYVANYDDEIVALFPGRFTSLSDQSNWTYNCVKSYQEDGTPNVVQLAPYYYMFSVGGWNYTKTNDMIRIIFPGGRLMDASGEVEITSVDIPEDGDVVTVKADVTIGADVSEARVAIVEGNDAETGNFLITHDRAEYVTITSSGEVTLTMPASNAPGVYSVIVSTYVDGKATEYNYDVFTYDPNAGKEWSLVGTGTYNYAQFFEGADPGLELYKSTVVDDLYKITHWGNDVDFFFTMDNHDAITVSDQYIGYTHSSYGDVYVDDFVNYAETVSEGISYFDGDTFHFNVVYYVEAGVFGYGYETFVLDADTPAAPARNLAPARGFKKGVLNKTRTDLQRHGILVPLTLFDLE